MHECIPDLFADMRTCQRILQRHDQTFFSAAVYKRIKMHNLTTEIIAIIQHCLRIGMICLSFLFCQQR